MPRAPHSSALLAGRPRAKRRGVVEQLLGGAVDALEQAERLAVDVGTGRKPSGSACQTKASAAAKSGSAAAGGRHALEGGCKPVQAGEMAFSSLIGRRVLLGKESGRRCIRPRFYRRAARPAVTGLPELVANGGHATIFRLKIEVRGRGRSGSAPAVPSRPSPEEPVSCSSPLLSPRALAAAAIS